MKAICLLSVLLLVAAPAWAGPPAEGGRNPTMLVGGLGLPGEGLLRFAERVKPDFVVMGAFGAPQWAAQKDPRAWIAQWRAIFSRMHKSGVKVVGMIELINVGNTIEESLRFVEFYQKRWEVKLLGPRPPVAAETLFEKRSMPVALQRGAHAPRGCAINPHWRAVERAFVKALIDAGIDGFITHRNLFGECGCPFCHAKSPGSSSPKPHVHKPAGPEPLVCEHCSGGLRRWLAERYDAKGLKKLGIDRLATHTFQAIYGHHIDHRKLPSPIELEGMKYARHAIKEAYDDIFVRHGRRLKPDLVLAQWNHMPYFDELHLDGGHIPRFDMTTFAHASADERWSLPPKLWGRGEDFYWYCNWGTCQNTQLGKRFLADVTLYAKLLRSFARGKPFVINKYDFYRPRNMMAEAAGLGMIAGAIQVPHGAPEDARVMARYFAFLKQHADLYRSACGTPLSDVLLVYPRLVTHAGDAAGVEMVEVAGRTLVVDHVQFDMVSDDLFDTVDLSGYRAVIVAEPIRGASERLAEYVEKGGRLIAVPRTAAKAADRRWKQLDARVVAGLVPHTGGTPAADPLRRELRKAVRRARVTVEAAYTLEAHAYRQGSKWVIHLVNYNHREGAKGQAVVERESPLASEPVTIRLRLPRGVTATGGRFLDPDSERVVPLTLKGRDGTVTFRTPGFLVYGVCVIEIR